MADPVASVANHGLSAVLALGFGVAWAAAQFVARRSTYHQGAERVAADPLDRWSYPFIVVAVGGSLTISVVTFLFGIGGYLPDWVLWVGVVFMLVGIPLKVWSLTTLGRFYGNPITVQDNHEIIEDGPYRWLRHPATTAAILTTVGLPLLLLTPIGLTVTAVSVTSAYVYRLYREEAVLASRLGDGYRTYSERTWRLVPWVY